MVYVAARGGHAPGHLRDAFIKWVELGMDHDGIEVQFHFEPRRVPVSWIVGHLWNCTDTMPSNVCDEMDLTPGSTFAQGVRSIRHPMR